MFNNSDNIKCVSFNLARPTYFIFNTYFKHKGIQYNLDLFKLGGACLRSEYFNNLINNNI